MSNQVRIGKVKLGQRTSQVKTGPFRTAQVGAGRVGMGLLVYDFFFEFELYGKLIELKICLQKSKKMSQKV